MADSPDGIARDILSGLLIDCLPLTPNQTDQKCAKKSILRVRARNNNISDADSFELSSPTLAAAMGETPPNCRRTGRKRKPSFLSAEYQELRRLVRKGEPDPLKVFLGTLDQDFVNVQDSEGCSLLNEIAIKTAQFVKIAEILISFKADVNLCDGMGNSPLHNSLMYYPATHDMVQLLIQHGADVNLRNKCGIVPVQMSDDEDLKKYIQSLRKGVDQLTALNIWLKTVQGPMQVCFETPPPPAGSCPVSPSSSAPSTSTLPATPMVSAGGGRGLKRPRQEEDDESSEEMDVTESCTSKKLRFVMHDSLGTPLKG